MAIRNINNNSTFRFSKVTFKDLVKEIRKLRTKKATQGNNIPVMVLKENTDVFANYMLDFFKECVDQGELPSILKNTNTTPVFKKYLRGSAENCRLVSILPVIAKIFEKLLTQQITSYMDKFLSKCQVLSVWLSERLQCTALLFSNTKNWKRAIDQGKVFGSF